MENDTKIEVVDEETKGNKNQKGSKAFQDIMGKLDELDEAHKRVVKSSRLLGITEGSLATLGVLGFGVLVKSIINRR